MQLLASLVPFLSKVFGAIFKALEAFFLIRIGRKEQQLAEKEKEIKDAKEAAKIKARITRLSDDDLDKLL